MDMTLCDARQTLERILAGRCIPDNGAGEIIRMLVRTALTACDGVVQHPLPAVPSGSLPAWQVRKAQQLMRESLANCLSIHAIAKTCGLSRSHFNRGFKLSVGMSPRDWLCERRIEKAQYLLINSHLSLPDVARICGFAEQCHFTRTFTRAVGMPPGVWRRSFGPASQSWSALASKAGTQIGFRPSQGNTSDAQEVVT